MGARVFTEGPLGQEIDRDPESILTYGLAFPEGSFPTGVSVTSVQWIYPAALTKLNEAINSAAVDHDGVTYPAGMVCYVKFSGGVAYSAHKVTARYTRSDGEIDDESFVLRMEQA